ncbi:MAG: response regulator [Deltaproteobacteria bacterium]|nr:response regulator [Deltaproteobacteria bacterium]MBI3389606.1 response regulator [Deltaproteobacteria bacterium]
MTGYEPSALLVRRLRLALWMSLPALAFFGLADLWRAAKLNLPTLLVRLAAAAILISVLLALRRRRLRSYALGLALAAGIALVADTAAVGVLTQDTTTPHLMSMFLTVATATLLPWGERWQLALVAASELGILANAWVLTGNVAPALERTGIAAIVAFVGSVFMAYELERNRRTIAERDTARDRAEAALRQSELRYRMVALATHDAIWDWDIVTNTLLWGDAVHSLFGYLPNQVGSTVDWWENHLHPDDRERVTAGVITTLGGRDTTWSAEYRFRRNDGSYADVVDRAQLIRDEHGRAVRAIGAMTDITDRKQAETERQTAEAALRDSEQRLQLAVDASGTGLWDCDLHTGTTQYSAAWRRLFGYGDDELPDTPETWAGVVHPDDLARIANDTQSYVSGAASSYESEFRIRHRDGSYRWVLSRARVFRDASGLPYRMLGSQIDITERKRSEGEVQQAKEAAETANHAKSQFLANMSHEIRTPLNGIIGMTELALQTELTPEQREYLRMVAASGDALMTVINDVLDFSKIEAGKLALDPVDFDLRDAIGDTMQAVAVRAHLKGLELAYEVHPDVPAAIVADPNRLRQILTNLIGNAIKFSEHGEVVVSVSPETSRVDEVRLHFRVRDSGIGIAADKQPAIFRAFEQADGSTTRKYGGTGLGLTIARRLVELMGGSLWVESAIGCGSTFHFTLRARVCPRLLRPPAPIEFLTGLSVLVVDDNATNRRILNELLTHWQMRPTTVDSGEAALGCMMHAATGGAPFPLVLVDAHMPEMDGFELAERIKRTPALAGATIMMLSSADLLGEAARCRELGVAAFLTKPLRQSELLEAMLLALRSFTPDASTASDVPRPADASARALRILLAEDNAVNQRLGVRLLEKRGHTVIVANNGREALAIFTRGVFDLVLMDIQMPVMDGFEATAAIRALELDRGTYTPIIALTANAMKGDQERCLTAGMDGYVSKPIQPAHLYDMIERIVPSPHRLHNPSVAMGQPGCIDVRW